MVEREGVTYLFLVQNGRGMGDRKVHDVGAIKKGDGIVSISFRGKAVAEREEVVSGLRRMR